MTPDYHLHNIFKRALGDEKFYSRFLKLMTKYIDKHIKIEVCTYFSPSNFFDTKLKSNP